MAGVSWARVGGPLAGHADGFRGELERLGYAQETAAKHMRLMAHLSRWLEREGAEAPGLTPELIEAFFAERRAAGYCRHVTSAALRPLSDYLLRTGVIAAGSPAVPSGPEDRLLARYREYLVAERGLTRTTADLNVRLVRPFVAGRAPGDGGLDLEYLTAGEVAGFVVAQSVQRPRSVSRIVTALRSLLDFLHVQGVTGQPLAAAALTPARRRAGLPEALGEAQVAALLDACDRSTRTGRRDLAIITMLARLGMRAGEVAGLQLDDIDWRRGEIAVRGKANRHDRLPLPADVGERIVAYLQDGRPPAAVDRAVFVRAQAPCRQLSYGAVSTVVALAGKRAGLGVIGAHQLRHSAATAMLRAGGSLTEIGQVLRHARPRTTASYAKVDIAALRPLARPWPGEPA